MSDTPWTKGRWLLTVRKAMGDAADCTVATIDHDGGPYRGDITRLQSAEHIGGIDAAEMIANARLIAAAPDMAEALETIVHMGHDCPATFPGDETAWEARRARMMQDIARAALAKALGAA